MEQQQLSGIDASFLYLETPETPMHVAGLTYFELPPGFEGSFYQHFRRFFESRLHTIPIFSKRLAPSLYDLDHPGWVDEDEIDLDYHLRETTLPAPGSEAQLEEVISRLHANTLDRSRPLWQFYIITGLANGQGVLYSKVHHAAVDGGAGMAINKALYDVTAVPREVAPPPPKIMAGKTAPSAPIATGSAEAGSRPAWSTMRVRSRTECARSCDSTRPRRITRSGLPVSGSPRRRSTPWWSVCRV